MAFFPKGKIDNRLPLAVKKRLCEISPQFPFVRLPILKQSWRKKMHELKTILKNAVAANDVPFVVAMTGNAKGTTWSGAEGKCAPGVAATQDTIFRIFSMTKAVGATAAMILIDQGKLSMDTPVEEILPQFADIQLLEGFDGDTPRMRPPKVKATVRHLATHTSGLTYEFWNANTFKYFETTGHVSVISGLKSALNYPLAFEPGERWDYGVGIDWLGQIVEAVDGRRIDAYCQEEIFAPLGMNDTRFEVNESMNERLAVVKARGEDGEFADFELAPPPNPEFYGMGHALYSSAPNYMRFLRMFLNQGQLEGNRVLSEGAVATMLANQIGSVRVGALKTLAPAITADAEFFPGLEKTHSFGFVRLEEDAPAMRKAGSQGWAGVLNTHYWFDPASDVVGLIMTQSLPFVEPRFLKVYEQFEKAVYAHAT